MRAASFELDASRNGKVKPREGSNEVTLIPCLFKSFSSVMYLSHELMDPVCLYLAGFASPSYEQEGVGFVICRVVSVMQHGDHLSHYF